MMQPWQDRALRNGPRSISVLLACLIVAECARVLLPLLGEHPSRTLRRVGASRNVPPHSSGLDVRSIVAAHLFGVAADDSHDPARASATTANLILQGTVATRDSKQGVAIIAASGPARVYRVGDDIEGAALHSVYSDHVLLDRGGRFETLTLPRSPLMAMPGALQPQAAPADDEAVETAPPAPPGTKRLATVVRAQPSVDGQSDLRGFIIHPSANIQAFLKSGLRQNDLVTAVNGASVSNQNAQRGQEIMDAMLAAGQATVTVVRDGHPVDVSIDLNP